MDLQRLDGAMGAGFIAAGLLFFLGGAGWALAGPDIFLATVTAGLAGCF